MFLYHLRHSSHKNKNPTSTIHFESTLHLSNKHINMFPFCVFLIIVSNHYWKPHMNPCWCVLCVCKLFFVQLKQIWTIFMALWDLEMYKDTMSKTWCGCLCECVCRCRASWTEDRPVLSVSHRNEIISRGQVFTKCPTSC